MKPTNEERRKVAENLRAMCIGECRYAEQFCELLKETVMDSWDFREFQDVADRLADLVEPMERICRFRWDGDELRCSACGEIVTQHDADSEYYVTENTARAFYHCPFCGAKVADE